MHWIKLHFIRTDGVVWARVEHIVRIAKFKTGLNSLDEGTVVGMLDDSEICVKESPDEIFNLINKSMRD